MSPSFVAAAATRAAAVASSSSSAAAHGGHLGGRYYTKTHEWFEVQDGGTALVGITQTAQRALGEVVFCRLPRPGDRFQQMDTLVTLEAVKSTAEVKCPVYGEVIEVNPRLEREPALVTRQPLHEGWLVRLAFSGRIPRYLRRSRAVPRSEVEEILGEPLLLQRFLQERLLGEGRPTAGPGGEAAWEAEYVRELTFDGLYAEDRLMVHRAAGALGLQSGSRGRGQGRQLAVRRPRPGRGQLLEGARHDDEGDDDPSAATGTGPWEE